MTVRRCANVLTGRRDQHLDQQVQGGCHSWMLSRGGHWDFAERDPSWGLVTGEIRWRLGLCSGCAECVGPELQGEDPHLGARAPTSLAGMPGRPVAGQREENGSKGGNR